MQRRGLCFEQRTEMKIYTRTGDDGTTSLVGGERVSKGSLRVEAYGSIDELNAWLGMVRAHDVSPSIVTVIERVQNELFVLGSELASGQDVSPNASMPLISQQDIDRLEDDIDRAEKVLPVLRSFILPGGTQGAAMIHVARTVARRAERLLVTLATEQKVRGDVIRYVNRLSDLLFVLSRRANHDAGVEDVPWQPPAA